MMRKISLIIISNKKIHIFRFKYTPSNSLFGFRTTGQMGVYDQGGFIKVFGSSQEEFKNEIEELKEK